MNVVDIETALLKYRVNPIRVGRIDGKWFARAGSFHEGLSNSSLEEAISILIYKLENTCHIKK